MTRFSLTRRGDVPLEFDGECLTSPHERGTIFTGIEVFRTAGGMTLLYVGTVGHQSYRQYVQGVYYHADKMTRTAIIAACGGSASDADKALKALGKATSEFIA